MDKNFQDLSQAVMDNVSALGRSSLTQKAYRDCFNLLGAYLKEIQSPYSPELASQWLCSVKDQLNKTEFALFRAAINKLSDLCLSGEMRSYHCDIAKTKAGRLCPEFRSVHQEFMAWDSDHADATVEDHSSGCAGILLRFQEEGVCTVSDITYEVLVREFFSSAEKTYYVRVSHHRDLRLLLRFIYDKYNAPYGYTLFVDGMAMRKGYFWNRVSPDDISRLRGVTTDADSLSLEDYLELCGSLYQEHAQEGYSSTSLTRVHRITELFYLFLDMNGLCYTPEAGRVWVDSVEPYVSSTEYKHFRRVICLIERRFKGIRFPLESAFSFKDTVYSKLPEWCLSDVDRFIETKKAEGWASSTVRMYKVCICRFCSFLDSHGLTSFQALTATDVKEFNRLDKHQTPAGKNAYNCRIKKFLRFLGEVGKLDNPFLFLSLPCTCAPQESLVITLTEEEHAQLRQIFDSEDSTVSLRKKAMIQLGLYMGLRASDIVNLTIDDIDWDKASIRVLQDKTDYEIVLPMPVGVANALYRYIMYERPASDTRNIFVRYHAPHVQVHRGACRIALKDALPERDIRGSGFHVTRKTFATNLLRNDTPPQQVAEALGHQNLSTVQKYLSLDEQRMKQCGLSLTDKGLSMKGGF